MRILLPKTDPETLGALVSPLFFLAGPIRGGADWQKECCLKLAERLQRFTAIVPCRWQAGHPLYQYRLEGPDRGEKARQTDWEYDYLERVAWYSKSNTGCIIFWLPEQSKEHPRDDGQPYARDTYGELGRWSVKASDESHLRPKVVVGAEAGFPGLSVIQRNLDRDFRRPFLIYPTLDQVVEAAVDHCIIDSH